MSIIRGTIQSGAEFSPCGTYRYSLWRTIEPTPGETLSGDAVWIGLNPSSADHEKLDNTTRRCLEWSRRWGCARYVMLNCFAYRATKPGVMLNADDPIGSENDEHISKFTAAAKIIVAAWGVHCDQLRAQAVCEAVAQRLDCLGTNGDGSPKHPLYVPGATERVLFWEPGKKSTGVDNHERTKHNGDDGQTERARTG